MSRLLTEEAFEQLTRERDEAIKSGIEWCAKAQECAQERDEARSRAEKADEFREQLRHKYRELEAQCAEMRATIRLMHGATLESGNAKESAEKMMAAYVAFKHALSSDCGKGFISVKELEPAIALLKEWLSVNFLDWERIKSELARLKKLKGEP